ncbi:MAG: hypothetical protein ACRCYT_05695 [Cetobacterium sp.]
MISISNYNKQAESILKDYLNGISLDVIYTKYNKNLAVAVIYTEINNRDITAIGYLNKEAQEIYPKYKKNIPVKILCSDYGVDAMLCFLLLNFLQTKEVNLNDLLICEIIKNREVSKSLDILEYNINKLFQICIFMFILNLIVGIALYLSF